MPTINVSREIGAPLDRVWSIISDVDNEAQYWHGTKSVRNISKNDNVIQREVVIAFKDAKTMQTVTLNPMTSIDTRITEGPITGSRIVTLNSVGGGDKTKVDVTWDFKLAGLLSVFGGMVKKHIAEGTEQALERIAKAAE
ncbi:oligoketide cyclase/lipid transport protein [Candidatus Nitrososphaera evergladensis SR1]|jgi:carbon monoxide dehydrogenase subunit G|uniref:Oligoketide cyclase/lipid transport protein n=1 Tax=Candidatus Nitrososphaera evergladensis SR1 TaxID=1459636 RepID=A0A075MSK2_9ARCH|nr:SRPBCC family protein [Candidatus Nitrososphaera evergladensis]AIF84556.1 oligoketide cyclase/lipid transport protein [Candidatus Nitrososphaera evergladensis SR1]